MISEKFVFIIHISTNNALADLILSMLVSDIQVEGLNTLKYTHVS